MPFPTLMTVTLSATIYSLSFGDCYKGRLLPVFDRPRKQRKSSHGLGEKLIRMGWE